MENRTWYPRDYNKGLDSRVHTDGSQVPHQALEEGRRVKRPKRCDNNNQDEETSPYIQSKNVDSCTMPSNIEIKARVSDDLALRERAKIESGSEPAILLQEDIFFHVPHGRLKLRKNKGSTSKLIAYERVDTVEAKQSDYNTTNVTEPDALVAVLTRSLGVKGIVKKRRELYMVGQTRIHVDDVEGLGSFMELEVVMKEGQTQAEGVATANDLMKKLHVQESDLVDKAYLDFLLDKQKS